MYRKIALSILALALLVIMAGFWYFNTQKKDIPSAGVIVKEVINDVKEINENKVEEKVEKIEEVKRPKEEIEDIVQVETRVIKKEIREAAKGRRYTDEEIDFILNPRKNTIEKLIDEKVVTEEEINSLD